MVIYGYNSSHLRTEPAQGHCPACATPDALRTSVFGRYVHLYWLPLLPIGKTGASECQHCHFVIRPKEMEPALRQSFRELKQRSRVPGWHFAGLLLALLGLGWNLVAQGNEVRANQSFISLPHKGDLYHVRTDNGHYSLWKVQDVAGNAVKLLANNYETDSPAQVAELNRPENFAPDPLELTRYDLNIMLEKEEIVDVVRK
ncbi:hypothetical protein CDA63_16395 [Hymenobacter amundsenii]|uniref:Zinc-ribbon 15 domain-containing protein n=1 Tax=Hymenobacter amundsenii TaxID=2006685 RepID=A0A246FHL8_9BACT|nr:hypothetical protein [Hymenobacter amundsenii]OWP62008.1 hypothetical protein CDA63_16395 [Hymenobacter amundsenii]